MTISLSNTGKRYNRDWIFRHLDYRFTTGNIYAITGTNGSGKSTLLQCIAGAVAFNEGNIKVNDQPVTDAFFHSIVICAPYLEVIEEMTATEFLHFHFNFKPCIAGWNPASILEHIGLSRAANKQIRYYSSGMKQRVKLAQAFFTDTPVLLLDEPCTNFDIPGYELYKSLLQSFSHNRIVIIASNDKQEYELSRHQLAMSSYSSTQNA